MGFGGPFGGIWHILTTVFTVVGGFVLFAALVVVTILLVRFLLVGTRAATLYLEKNSPATSAATQPPAAQPAVRRTPTKPSA
jgi:hypothetical protein